MSQPRLLGGRYELDTVIGRGGMAEVYRARDLRLDRIVAVKTLRSDLARDPTFQARFRREAQSAASLNHPSVIAVYDTGEDMIGDNSIPYIVMEYVDGSTLRDLIRENRALRPEKALEVTDGILRALDYSHRGGIVHRDIKPANVMLTRQHEVKVMDFGIARAMADTASTMTQTAQVIGTAQYLSPEQARGERVDTRSDLYSTGCVLYELLTGRPPFTGDSPVAIAYQHVREEPVPPSQVDPDIPQWADAIVLKAMAKQADHRYQTATEFRQEIQRVLHGQPVASTAASTMLMAGVPAQGTQVMNAPQTQMQRPARRGYDQYDELGPVQYDDEGKGGAGKKAAIWIGAAAAVILVAALIGLALSDGGEEKPQQITVPAVVEQDLEAAKQQITAAGLRVGTVTEQHSDDVAKGKVIESDPVASSQVAPNSEIALVVSLGKKPPETAKVPNVRAKSQSAAEQELTALGFNVTIAQEKSNDVQEGSAVRTDPAAGRTVRKGSNVTLYVSSGVNLVKVPQLVGQQRLAACARLRSLGLQCQVAQEPPPPDNAHPEGFVWEQSLPADTEIPPGQSVTIKVVPKPDPPPSPGGDE